MINEFHRMMGRETFLMTAFSGETVVRLASYMDGSLGIYRDGKLIHIWELQEVNDCIDTFLQLMSHEPAVLIFQQQQATRSAGKLSFQPAKLFN